MEQEQISPKKQKELDKVKRAKYNAINTPKTISNYPFISPKCSFSRMLFSRFPEHPISAFRFPTESDTSLLHDLLHPVLFQHLIDPIQVIHTVVDRYDDAGVARILGVQFPVLVQF